MQFFRPDMPVRRLVAAYGVAAIWSTSMYVGWIAPCPFLHYLSTGPTEFLGVLGPLIGHAPWIVRGFAFGYWPEINIIGFVLTLIATLVMTRWCAALHRCWLHKVPMRFALYESRPTKRRRLGLCERCGYDLRANSAAGCPECGWMR